MSRTIAALLSAAFLAGTLSATVAMAQEAKKQEGGAHEEMMAAWAKAAAPGENHKYLEVLQGDWKMAGKSWMDPAAEPMAWDGTSKKTMLMGGRYLREEVKSQMEGDVFTGVGVLGYNNLTQKYWSIWYDSMSTGVAFSEGTCDSTGKVFKLVGDYDDPMTGGKTKARTVLTIVDKGTHTYETYQINPDGSEFKSMEITYLRQ